MIFATIYLRFYLFDIVLKFIQYLYALFIRASKFSWASILLFCEGLQLQIVNMFFYFDEALVPVNDKNYWR